MDYSGPGSSDHGILQARILEWVAIPSSMGSSQPGIKPRSPAFQADSLLSEPPAKPLLNEVRVLLREFQALCSQNRQPFPAESMVSSQILRAVPNFPASFPFRTKGLLTFHSGFSVRSWHSGRCKNRGVCAQATG